MKKSITLRVWNGDYAVMNLLSLDVDLKMYHANCVNLETGEMSVLNFTKEEYLALPTITLSVGVSDIKVSEIQVLVGTKGSDEVHLTLDTPTAFPNMGYATTAKVHVQAGYGQEWLKKVFPGVEYEVIDMRPRAVVSIP